MRWTIVTWLGDRLDRPLSKLGSRLEKSKNWAGSELKGFWWRSCWDGYNRCHICKQQNWLQRNKCIVRSFVWENISRFYSLLNIRFRQRKHVAWVGLCKYSWTHERRSGFLYKICELQVSVVCKLLDHANVCLFYISKFSDGYQSSSLEPLISSSSMLSSAVFMLVH